MTMHARREKGSCIHGGQRVHAFPKEQCRHSCTTEGGGSAHAQKEKSSLAGVPLPQKLVSDGVDDDDGGCIVAIFSCGVKSTGEHVQ